MRNLGGALILTAMIFAVATAFIAPAVAKTELCRTYYRELSTFACLLSSYGLPHPQGKR